MTIKRWKLPEYKIEHVDELSRESGLSWVVSAVLASRGISTAHEAKAFISGGDTIEDPFVLKDMDKAAKRVLEAIENGEKIAVYGDYDCDGITATALLASYLQSVGASVLYYVPDRDKEGYGLNKAAIEMLCGQNINLLITVDNGVSAHDEVDFANSIGIDVVITDHHTTRETMPRAVAVVNPHRKDCPSIFKDLAGVGVAFKLICAIENAEPSELLEYYSDLVALGTIADVVPLTGENRVIVRQGLVRLCESGRPGIDALLAVGGLTGKAIRCETAAFGIIPRINAAGRMGGVDDVIELLLTDDAGYAEEVAAFMDGQNIMRKQAEEQIMLQIRNILDKNRQLLSKRVLVLSGKGWHHGVLGIVSSKLMEKYGKPCILLSVDGDIARGSGRSIDGFSMIEAITACSKHLDRFGGHQLAAGLTLKASAVEAFEADLQVFARDNHLNMPVQTYNIDCVLPCRLLNVESAAELSALEPFGQANESPLFLLSGLLIEGIYPTADCKHIRIKLAAENTLFYAIYFGMSASDFPYCAGIRVDVVAQISAGEYNGKQQLSVKVRDVRPSGVPEELILSGRESYFRHLRREYYVPDFSRLLPDREDIAVIYKFLRKYGEYTYGALSLYYQIMDSGIDFCRMLVALDIMEELRLINRNDENGAISLIPDPARVNIEHSLIISNLKAEMQVKGHG